MSESAKRGPEEESELATKRPALEKQDEPTEQDATATVDTDATDATDLGAQEQIGNGQEPSGEDTLEVNPSNNDGNGQGEHDNNEEGNTDPQSAQPAGDQEAQQGQPPVVPPLPTQSEQPLQQPLMGDTPASQPLLNTVSQTTLEDGQVVETVAVSEVHVSKLVGADNANIAEMQAASGAQITVPTECEPGTINRNIAIQGTVEQVAQCRSLMQEKLRSEVGAAEGEGSGEIVSRITRIPDEHVGRVIGRGGSTIRQIQELSGAHMDIAKECRPGEAMREVTITGLSEQVDRCEEYIHKKVAGEVLPPPPSRMPSGNDTVISIPDQMVGRIIGRHGSTIREIQDTTGAHLDVAKSYNTATGRRNITVRGTQQQVAYCVQLINFRLAELTGDFTTSYVEAPQDVLAAGMMIQASMGPAFGQRQGQYGQYGGGYNAQMYGQPQQMTYAQPGYQMYQQPSSYNAQAYQNYMAQYQQYAQAQQSGQQPQGQQAAQQYYQQPQQQYYDYSQYYQQQGQQPQQQQ